MNEFPLYGALDIGSNAARILFAHVIPGEKDFNIFKNSLLRLPLRLGEDVYETGRLSSQKINALIETLKVFSSLLRIYQPVDSAVYATAALREAENAAQVLDLLKAETGFSVNIIDGYEEARLIKELYATRGKKDDIRVLTDLGGGSLEITILLPSGEFFSESFKIGAVRALKNGISHKETVRMHVWLKTHLLLPKNNMYFIGTGGNINTLRHTFASPNIEYLETEKLKQLLTELEPLTVSERITNHHIRPDRADVIIPAIKIFIDLMERIGVSRVHVPGASLSDAIILELHKKNVASQK
jgi:exopolyphosphatase/guanosine-5'-triphosphate,3'-diphosphate pyrophosphatase